MNAAFHRPETRIYQVVQGLVWLLIAGSIFLMVAGMFTLALFAGIIGKTPLRAVLSIREEQFRMNTSINHVVVTPRVDYIADSAISTVSAPQPRKNR